MFFANRGFHYVFCYNYIGSVINGNMLIIKLNFISDTFNLHAQII